MFVAGLCYTRWHIHRNPNSSRDSDFYPPTAHPRQHVQGSEIGSGGLIHHSRHGHPRCHPHSHWQLAPLWLEWRGETAGQHCIGSPYTPTHLVLDKPTSGFRQVSDFLAILVTSTCFLPSISIQLKIDAKFCKPRRCRNIKMRRILM